MGALNKLISDLSDIFGFSPVESSSVAKGGLKERQSGTIPLQESQLEDVVFSEPNSFSEVQIIVDKLKEGSAVVVKLEEVTPEEAGKIINFISGAIYALEGDSEKLADNIFLFTPPEVKITYK